MLPDGELVDVLGSMRKTYGRHPGEAIKDHPATEQASVKTYELPLHLNFKNAFLADGAFAFCGQPLPGRSVILQIRIPKRQ